MTMTIDQFRATGRTITCEEFASSGGPAEFLPPNATAVRLYGDSNWIVQTGERVTGTDEHNWYLILDTEEYDTFSGGGLTLADLEELLFDWARLGEPDADPRDALLREACDLLDGIRSDETEAFIARVGKALNTHAARVA